LTFQEYGDLAVATYAARENRNARRFEFEEVANEAELSDLRKAHVPNVTHRYGARHGRQRQHYQLDGDIDVELTPAEQHAVFGDALVQKYGVRGVLYELWGRFGAWRNHQPLQLVRRYFGEKFVFYFAFLGSYTAWLLLPSLLGLITLFYGLGNFRGRQDAEDLCNSNITVCGACSSCNKWELKDSCLSYQVLYIFDNEFTVAFAWIMSIWATLFHDSWLRREAELAYDYEVDDAQDLEPQRPQFEAQHGVYQRNPVTGVVEKYYPKQLRYMKYSVTVSTVLVVCACVIIALVGTIVYRLAVYISLLEAGDGTQREQTEASLVASSTAAVINLVFILLLSLIYPYLAIFLTNWENHKTESAYERHLTFKVFLFNAVNLYSSLFYVAFFQSRDIGVPGNYDRFLGYEADRCPTY
ncbi:uncharacterized protein MONBRDRAFT_30659, partial [Monosiga brevicollis MX1]